MIKEEGSITILYAGSDRIELAEALKKDETNVLVTVDDTNATNIIKSHERQHQQR